MDARIKSGHDNQLDLEDRALAAVVRPPQHFAGGSFSIFWSVAETVKSP